MGGENPFGYRHEGREGDYRVEIEDKKAKELSEFVDEIYGKKIPEDIEMGRYYYEGEYGEDEEEMKELEGSLEENSMEGTVLDEEDKPYVRKGWTGAEYEPYEDIGSLEITEDEILEGISSIKEPYGLVGERYGYYGMEGDYSGWITYKTERKLIGKRLVGEARRAPEVPRAQMVKPLVVRGGTEKERIKVIKEKEPVVVRQKEPLVVEKPIIPQFFSPQALTHLLDSIERLIKSLVTLRPALSQEVIMRIERRISEIERKIGERKVGEIPLALRIAAAEINKLKMELGKQKELIEKIMDSLEKKRVEELRKLLLRIYMENKQREIIPLMMAKMMLIKVMKSLPLSEKRAEELKGFIERIRDQIVITQSRLDVLQKEIAGIKDKLAVAVDKSMLDELRKEVEVLRTKVRKMTQSPLFSEEFIKKLADEVEQLKTIVAQYGRTPMRVSVSLIANLRNFKKYLDFKLHALDILSRRIEILEEAIRELQRRQISEKKEVSGK